MSKCVEPGFSFKSPPNSLIVGPTRCGKITFLHHLLLENSRFLFSHLLSHSHTSIPTPQKHRTELERLKEFGYWGPWEKRGYDPYQAFEDDETPKSRKGKGRGKNRPS